MRPERVFVYLQPLLFNDAEHHRSQACVPERKGLVPAVRAIVDQPDPQIAIDTNWLSAYPYQSDWRPGQTGEIELRLRNWIWAESKVQTRIRAPKGWKVEPAELNLTAPSRGTAAQSFRVTVPDDPALRSRRFVLVFDTVRDGVPLGEVTEALINVDPLRAH